MVTSCESIIIFLELQKQLASVWIYHWRCVYRRQSFEMFRRYFLLYLCFCSIWKIRSEGIVSQDDKGRWRWWNRKMWIRNFKESLFVTGNWICGPMVCPSKETLMCIVTEKSTNDSKIVKVGSCIGRFGKNILILLLIYQQYKTLFQIIRSVNWWKRSHWYEYKSNSNRYNVNINSRHECSGSKKISWYSNWSNQKLYDAINVWKLFTVSAI